MNMFSSLVGTGPALSAQSSAPRPINTAQNANRQNQVGTATQSLPRSHQLPTTLRRPQDERGRRPNEPRSGPQGHRRGTADKRADQSRGERQQQTSGTMVQLSPSVDTRGKGQKLISFLEDSWDSSLHGDDRAAHYRKERDEADAELRRAEIEHQQDKAEIVQLHKELLKSQSALQDLEKSVDAMHRNLDNKEALLGRQCLDSEIAQQLNAIMNRVKTWSLDFNAEAQEERPIFDNRHLQDYRVIAPMCSNIEDLVTLTKGKSERRLFVRGWVAYIMTRRFFGVLDPSGPLGSDIWIDRPLETAYRKVQDALWEAERAKVPDKAFNEWRALTMDILSRLPIPPSVEEKIQSDLQTGVAEVMSLVGAWSKLGTAPVGPVDKGQNSEDKLASIFQQAMELAKLLRRQRALWRIRWPKHQPGTRDDLEQSKNSTLVFTPTTMEDKTRREEEADDATLTTFPVSFIIFPVLFKRGTMDGDRYDFEEPVVKALVMTAE